MEESRFAQKTDIGNNILILLERKYPYFRVQHGFASSHANMTFEARWRMAFEQSVI